MSWSGAGAYTLPAAFTPEVNGTTIDAARYNGATSDIATGISACLAKNGENVATANLPMGGFKHTGVGDGAAAGQYLAYNQATTAALASLNLTGTTVPVNGIYLPAANTLGFASNTTARGNVNSTGNWTLNAPSSGVPLTITSTATSGPSLRLTNAGTSIEAVDETLGTIEFYSNDASVSSSGVFGKIGVYNEFAGLWDGTASRVDTYLALFCSQDGSLAEKLRISSGGVLGLGVVPSSWASAARALEFTYPVVGQDAAGSAIFGFNAYNSTGVTWVYKTTDEAALFSATTGGGFTWQTAVSGTAGNNVTWSDRLTLTLDGRLYGNALHNNAGAVTGTTNQYIASGTYTPTLTNGTNASASTPAVCQWIRVGNVVTVSGKFTVTPTTGSGTPTKVSMSLPIASALVADNQLGGTTSCITTQFHNGVIYGDAANDRAQIDTGGAASGVSQDNAFQFTYLVV